MKMDKNNKKMGGKQTKIEENKQKWRKTNERNQPKSSFKAA